MGTIKAYRKTHWVIALDADLASIPNPQLGDTVLTEDKKKLYYWQGGAWKTGLGYEFVPRNPAAPDFTKVDFTLAAGWQVDALDLSGIVPAGAVSVRLRIYYNHAAVSYFSIRKNAVDLEVFLQTQVNLANTPDQITQDMNIDSDRLVDYVGQHTPVTTLDVSVCGWFI
ncbi:hypothetical protein ES703_58582 [subsurface metagenome]